MEQQNKKNKKRENRQKKENKEEIEQQKKEIEQQKKENHELREQLIKPMDIASQKRARFRILGGWEIYLAGVNMYVMVCIVNSDGESYFSIYT